MKLLCIIQCTHLGGMEQSTLLLLQELLQMGYECEVISLNEVGALGEQLKKYNIPVSSTGYIGKWGWLSFLPLRRLLRTKKADMLLMVGHNLMASLAMGDLCKDNRILGIHFHHRGVLPNWAWRIIYGVAVSRFKYITFPSKFIMHEAMEVCPFLPPTMCRTLPVPVPVPPLTSPEERRECRQKLGLPLDTRLIGNAGWLIKRKRIDILLDVAQIVLKEVPEARFTIAGDGPELPNLKAKAAELGISDKVIWLGWQQEMITFFKSLDVLLFNSDWDAMGRTPLEAMAQGIPVVASVVHGGLKEVLSKDDYGSLIDTHDVRRLADSVIGLLKDPDFAEKRGLRGRERIKEVGEVHAHTIQTLELFGQK